MTTVTIRDIVEGYKLANEWERQEEKKNLPHLTVEDSVQQFLELYELAWRVSPQAEEIFLEQRMKHYVELHDKLKRAAKVMGHAVED